MFPRRRIFRSLTLSTECGGPYDQAGGVSLGLRCPLCVAFQAPRSRLSSKLADDVGHGHHAIKDVMPTSGVLATVLGPGYCCGEQYGSGSGWCRHNAPGGRRDPRWESACRPVFFPNGLAGR